MVLVMTGTHHFHRRKLSADGLMANPGSSNPVI